MGQAIFQRIAKVRGQNDPFAIGRFIAEAERCLHMLDDQLALSSGPFVLGQRCTLVDVACFPYCASAYWANVDISAMSHLLAWIEMLHQRPSFSTGLTVPFPRPAFFDLRMQHRRKSRWRLRVPVSPVILEFPVELRRLGSMNLPAEVTHIAHLAGSFPRNPASTSKNRFLNLKSLTVSDEINKGVSKFNLGKNSSRSRRFIDLKKVNG